jgi:hypothetical protein
MDLSDIKSAILGQLSGKTGIDSLKIQNHIYGCFIIMEDIAQQKVAFLNNLISNGKYMFDLDKQFSEIGVRYGFIMDTKLIFYDSNQDYKNTWIKYFNDLHSSHNIEQADSIEDAIIEVIQKCVPADEAFFINSLETGALKQEWIDKVIRLLQPTMGMPADENSVNQQVMIQEDKVQSETALTAPGFEAEQGQEQDAPSGVGGSPGTDVIPPDNSAISHAITEKPMKSRRTGTVTATTRRSYKMNINNPTKKILARTRRHRK